MNSLLSNFPKIAKSIFEFVLKFGIYVLDLTNE